MTFSSLDEMQQYQAAHSDTMVLYGSDGYSLVRRDDLTDVAFLPDTRAGAVAMGLLRGKIAKVIQ